MDKPEVWDDDNDPDGNGKAGIWGYLNNHEDIFCTVFERLNKLEEELKNLKA